QVRLFRARKARVLPHRPELRAIAAGEDAAREGRGTRQRGRPSGWDVGRAVDGPARQAGGRGSGGIAHEPDAKLDCLKFERVPSARGRRLRVKLGPDVARTLSGNLDTFSLADLLQWLEINALSGRVTVWRGEVLRTIDLKGGAIVFVSSSPPYELLGESFATGKNLTRLILERNLLGREKLAEAVEGLAMKILLDLFHWGGA